MAESRSGKVVVVERIVNGVGASSAIFNASSTPDE